MDKKLMKQKLIEVRCWDFKGHTLQVEKRDGEPTKIVGYAAVFNSDSDDLGGFIERIKPGAFKNALKKSDARALFNHNSDWILGRQSAGTLNLKEDSTGLYMEIIPPDTQFARDLMVSIDRGDIKEQSFGFRLVEGGSEWHEKDGITRRTITEVDELFDVSPVTYPAYPETDVALRSLELFKKQSSGERTGLDDMRRRGRLLSWKEKSLKLGSK